MNKILLVIIILAFIIATITVGTVKPVLYKQVVFAPQNVEIANTEPEIIEKPVYVQQIKPIEKPVETIKTQAHQQVQSKTIIKQTSKNEPIQKNIQKPEQKTVQKPKLPQSVREIAKQDVREQPKTEQIKTIQTPTAEEPPKTTTITTPKQINVVPKQLTEQEEIIVWNRWRSNLQNKVMQEVKLNAPLGTRFRFSFTVDRYGQISNLKVWSDNPEYTSLAVRQIKPLLQSYQGQPILNFPNGTKRIITNVTGGFVLATFDKYSKPSDYSDVERVKYTR